LLCPYVWEDETKLRVFLLIVFLQISHKHTWWLYTRWKERERERDVIK